jgi:hypothetical protein
LEDKPVEEDEEDGDLNLVIIVINGLFVLLIVRNSGRFTAISHSQRSFKLSVRYQRIQKAIGKNKIGGNNKT